MPDRAAWAQIDLSAIEHNIKEIKSKLSNNTKLCAVIKANGYGHGALAMAKTSLKAGAQYLAVSMLQEAMQLRDAGIQEPILILGYTPVEQSDCVVRNSITQTVFSLKSAKVLSKVAVHQNKIAKIHLKIDTGMRRIGVLPEEAGILAKKIAALPNVEIEGVFSHFADSDSIDKSFTYTQLERFRMAISLIEAQGINIPIKHMANSAAILEVPEAHFDMVRAGVILYGLWPSTDVKKTIDLKPAFSLKAYITQIKHVPANESISYGCTFFTKRDSIIATLPLGYADGYMRLLAGKAMAEVKGQRVPVVGRICMDQCMIDVTDVHGVKQGDTVTLCGGMIPVDEVAKWLGTINYEIICMVGSRIPRMYV